MRCDYYDYDYDYSGFHCTEIRHARKMHKCNQCRQMIQPKFEYAYHSGKYDGGMYVIKHCSNCWNLLTWLRNNLPCYCFSYDDLFQYAIEQIGDAEKRAPEETKGLFWDFQRRYYKVFKKVRRYGG